MSSIPVSANVLTLDSNGNYVETNSIKANITPYAAPTTSQNLAAESQPFPDPNIDVATDITRTENPASIYDMILEETNALALDAASTADITVPVTSIATTIDIAASEQQTFEPAPPGDLVFTSIVKPETNLPEIIEAPKEPSSKPLILKAMPSLNVLKTDESAEGITPSGQNLFDHIIREEVAKYSNIDIAFVKAVIAAESNFNVTAVSPKGAMGLMQIMPDTAERYSVINPFSPEQNIRTGTAELSRLMDIYRNPSLALAGYNAGEGAVEKYDGVPPFSETQQYIVRVLTKTFQDRERLLIKEESEAAETIMDEKDKEKMNPLSRPLVVQTFDY